MYNPAVKLFMSSRYFEVKLVIYYFRIPPKQKKLSEILCPSKKFKSYFCSVFFVFSLKMVTPSNKKVLNYRQKMNLVKIF